MFRWLRRVFERESDEPEKRFHSSIAGVTRKNGDGSSRQKIIKDVAFVGMRLTLNLEEDNPVDRNAIALLTPGGRQVGYLNRHLAADVRSWLEDGMEVVVEISDLTGGSADKPTRGVNILVTAR